MAGFSSLLNYYLNSSHVLFQIVSFYSKSDFLGSSFGFFLKNSDLKFSQVSCNYSIILLLNLEFVSKRDEIDACSNSSLKLDNKNSVMHSYMYVFLDSTID